MIFAASGSEPGSLPLAAKISSNYLSLPFSSPFSTGWRGL